MNEKLNVSHCCNFLLVLLILTASCTLGCKCYIFLSSSIYSVYTLCFVRRNNDLLSFFKVVVALEGADISVLLETRKYFLHAASSLKRFWYF